MSQIAITTSQNVNISFHAASIGERLMAFIIDWLIKGAFLLVIFFIFFRFFKLNNYLSTLDQWSAGAILTLITLPVYIYTVVLESLMEGQTFGKKAMKIRVVKIDGYQASFADYLMRWLFRLVDIYSNSGVVGLISMIASKNNQRLGDLATGTAVISLKSAVNISHTILENLKEDYVPTFPQVVGLTDNDVRIIKENYQRALRSDDVQVIQRLAAKIREILKLEVDPRELTDRKFVGIIIKDYNYFTGREV